MWTKLLASSVRRDVFLATTMTLLNVLFVTQV